MRKIKNLTLSLAAVIVLGAVGLEAVAQDEAWRKDRFMVSVGMYWPNLDTRIRVDDARTGLGGTLLNLERDLALEDRKTQVGMNAHFRFARRHAVEFEYLKLDRKGPRIIAFGIDYDGRFIGINEDVETTFNTEVSRLAYRFSFINSDNMELSASVGLHITDLEVGLNIVGQEEDFNAITAPLPALGAAWKYHFNDRLSLHLRGEWLDIKISNIHGRLGAGTAELIWYPLENFGASIGYDVWDLDVSAKKSDLTGKLDYTYDGPKLALRARF